MCFVPEVFHELNPLGTVLAYDEPGKDKGNADKFAKPLEHHDSDAQFIDFVHQQAYCNGKVGSMGVCIGGRQPTAPHSIPLFLRAFCLYQPTFTPTPALRLRQCSLSRSGDIQGVSVGVWQARPHVSAEGRGVNPPAINGAEP